MCQVVGKLVTKNPTVRSSMLCAVVSHKSEVPAPPNMCENGSDYTLNAGPSHPWQTQRPRVK